MSGWSTLSGFSENAEGRMKVTLRMLLKKLSVENADTEHEVTSRVLLERMSAKDACCLNRQIQATQITEI